jgi:hypothetical protein
MGEPADISFLPVTSRVSFINGEKNSDFVARNSVGFKTRKMNMPNPDFIP